MYGEAVRAVSVVLDWLAHDGVSKPELGLAGGGGGDCCADAKRIVFVAWVDTINNTVKKPTRRLATTEVAVGRFISVDVAFAEPARRLKGNTKFFWYV